MPIYYLNWKKNVHSRCHYLKMIMRHLDWAQAPWLVSLWEDTESRDGKRAWDNVCQDGPHRWKNGREKGWFPQNLEKEPTYQLSIQIFWLQVLVNNEFPLSFFKDLFILCVFWLHVFMYRMRSEKVSDMLKRKLWTTMWVLGLKPGPLQEHILLTAELSLQS